MAPTPAPKLFVLIPCAGVGRRSGGSVPKQYQRVAGHPMLYHSLSAFNTCPELEHILVVLAPEDRHFNLSDYTGLNFEVHHCGGPHRFLSVLNGIEALSTRANQKDWVLVHDAARPGITPSLIRQLIQAAWNHPVGGIVALPITDTIKRASPQTSTATCIECTPSRERLWQAQTPQMFRIGLLKKALLDAQHTHTVWPDEASVLEALGHAPLLIPGHPRNFKVTYAQDFVWAEHILSQSSIDPPTEGKPSQQIH